MLHVQLSSIEVVLLQAAMSFFKLLSPIYTYIFLFVRSILAPPVILWFCIRMESAKQLPFSCRYALYTLVRHDFDSDICTIICHDLICLSTTNASMRILAVCMVCNAQNALSRLAVCHEQVHLGSTGCCDNYWQPDLELQAMGRSEEAVC